VSQSESHKTSEYHSVDGVEEKMDSQSRSTAVVPPGAVVPARQTAQRKHVAPRFITPVMGKIVDQGVDVTLECLLDGKADVGRNRLGLDSLNLT
jgi:hypothetical protein